MPVEEGAQVTSSWDVVILGGGMAGLTLALQLRRECPSASMLILDRESHPVPEAAHKVGESTVELGAHYLRETLGLQTYLEECHLRKFGTRFFFRSASSSEALEHRLEVGGTSYLPAESYQLDRGRLENFLREEVGRNGATFLDRSTVEAVAFSEGTPHRVRYSQSGKTREIEARWVIDASGRSEIIKRARQLARPVLHQGSAAWFRIGEKLNIDDWSSAEQWLVGHRDPGYSRWFSTNHLMGQGYWVWIIPLSSGATSIGIVTDEKFHPLASYSTFDRALRWLELHEPVCAERVKEHQDRILDYRAIRNYSRDTEQVFSSQRWCLTGEAGTFVDPFYSPGSDFIAMANSFIADLVRRDFAGEPVQQRTQIYDELFREYCEHTFTVYEDQYELFGDPVAMPVKIIWDFTIYWAFFAFIFCHGRLCDLLSLRSLRSDLERIPELNSRVQTRLLEWHREGTTPPPPGRIELPRIRFIREMNASLVDPLSAEQFRERLKWNVELLDRLAQEIDHCSGRGDLEVGSEDLLMPEVWAQLGVHP